MAAFSIDFPGRVKNFELPRTKPLMPLFETIVNSIYAIEALQYLQLVRSNFYARNDL